MSDAILQTADSLLAKIRHCLVTKIGKVDAEANPREFYYALCSALREEIMINWSATEHTYQHKRARTTYYLSMEYLPGKFLSSIITNLNGKELIKAILQKSNRSWEDLLEAEPDAGLGNGGLGRLASCLIDSLATQQYPAVAYGLRYQYGIFEQEIWDGVQVERPDCWLLYENPWEFRRDNRAQAVYFRGHMIPARNSHGDEVHLLEDYEEVRALAYDYPIVGYTTNPNYTVNTLRLWTTKESPRNFQLQRYNAGQLDQAAENTSLTDVLYPNDHHDTGKRIRLKQEFLLVSASLQDIIKNHLHVYGDLSNLPDKVQIQINDTHPALVLVELVRRLTKDHDFKWGDAWELTKECCNYTNHTVLKEALEEWNEQRMAYLLPRQYYIIQKLNQQFCNKVRERFSNNEEKVRAMSFLEKGQIKMANLCIYGCKKVNGVAKIHTEILRERIFQDFAEMYPEKFVHITNGVTPRNWLLWANPKLTELITEKIGSDWIRDFHKIEQIRQFAANEEVQKRFLEIKHQNKEQLISYLNEKNPIRDNKGRIITHFRTLTSDALFDLQIKRIHEYKRQLMNALHIIMLYQELKEKKSDRIPRMVIVAGKAAPGYEVAKDIIHLFYCLARTINHDPEVNHKLCVAFIENYNVTAAETLIPAADLSQQISTAGMEASGTGNMKLAMNGALTIGTEDGANIEMREAVGDAWWPFSFGASAKEIEELKQNQINPAIDIYKNNAQVHKAVDALKDGCFCVCEHEDLALKRLHQLLLEGSYDSSSDRYFVLYDLLSYYETHKKVEQLYQDPLRWAEYALQNIAGMSRFSSDEVINNYVQSIWNLEKCPVDLEILNKIRFEFSETEVCRNLRN